MASGYARQQSPRVLSWRLARCSSRSRPDDRIGNRAAPRGWMVTGGEPPPFCGADLPLSLSPVADNDPRIGDDRADDDPNRGTIATGVTSCRRGRGVVSTAGADVAAAAGRGDWA